jgi:hypothetical protein
MSLVTVKRNQETTSTNIDIIKPTTLKSPTQNDNKTQSPLTTPQTTTTTTTMNESPTIKSTAKKINFKDLKAIYSSSTSSSGGPSYSSSKSLPCAPKSPSSNNKKDSDTTTTITTSPQSQNKSTSNFSLFHRKTIPRNKPTSNNICSSSMGFTSPFFKQRSSLNSIDLSSPPSKTSNSLCIRLKSGAYIYSL